VTFFTAPLSSSARAQTGAVATRLASPMLTRRLIMRILLRVVWGPMLRTPGHEQGGCQAPRAACRSPGRAVTTPAGPLLRPAYLAPWVTMRRPATPGTPMVDRLNVPQATRILCSIEHKERHRSEVLVRSWERR
jgi:hypothetical protein